MRGPAPGEPHGHVYARSHDQVSLAPMRGSRADGLCRHTHPSAERTVTPPTAPYRPLFRPSTPFTQRTSGSITL